MIWISVVLNSQESPVRFVVWNAPWAILVSFDWRIIVMIFESNITFTIFTSLKRPSSGMVFTTSHVSSINVMSWIETILFEVNFKPSVRSTFGPLGCIRSTVWVVYDHTWRLLHVTNLVPTICWVVIAAIVTESDVDFTTLVWICPSLFSEVCTHSIEKSVLIDWNTICWVEVIVCRSILLFLFSLVLFGANLLPINVNEEVLEILMSMLFCV